VSCSLAARVREFIKAGGFRRDAAVLFSTTAVARGVLIVSMPLVARVFAPSEVGNWQLFVSIATVAGVVACWRYELAIPLPEQESKAKDLVQVSMAIAALMAALLALVLWVAREPFVRWVATPQLDAYLWYLPPFVFLLGIEQAATYWLTRTGEFTRQGTSRLLKSGLSTGAPLALAPFLEARSALLIVGSCFGQLASTALLLWKRQREPVATSTEAQPSLPRLQRWREVMLEYRNYPLYVAPYAFVSQFAKRVVYMLLASFASQNAVGYFTMAMQFTLVPVTFVTAALNQAFYRRTSIAGGDLRSLEALVNKVLRLQVIAALPPFVLVVLHAPLVLGFLLGPGWEETAGYVAWLSAPSMMQFLTAWLDRVFDALGRQRLAVGLQLAYDAVSLTCFAGLLLAGHSALEATAAYAVITALYNMIWLAVTFQIAEFSLRPLGKLSLLAIALVGAQLILHGLIRGQLCPNLVLTLEAFCATVLQLLILRFTRNLRT
jgi:lipopolysaccharide exporter